MSGAAVRLLVDVEHEGRLLRAGSIAEDLGEFARVLVTQGRAVWANATHTMERRPRGGKGAV